MTNCKTLSLQFPACKSRKVELNFEGGDVSSDGGILLLKEIDQQLGLLSKASACLPDPRDQSRIHHETLTMLRQRVYGIALGYEDLNDHDHLRSDIAFQTAVQKEAILASNVSLCRFEHRVDRQAIVKIHEVLIDQFISSYNQAPKELILDFDATDDEVHGQQMGRFYHGYYGHYCFLPLYVFCGTQVLVSYLRPSSKDGALHAWAILSLLVKRLRQAWPQVQIIFRGDSGFCRPKMLEWCDRHNVFYIIGLARNPRLERLLAPTMTEAQKAFDLTTHKQRLFANFYYAAQTWKRERRVIGKAEITLQGPNPRFIVTNLPGESQHLYEDVYCARGNMENRIKETQLELFAERTSCHNWWPNQFRLLLSSLAYSLIERLRTLYLQGTELATTQVQNIRLKLFKIGAVITRNTRRIRFLLSSSYPYSHLFCQVVHKLVPT